MSTVHFQREPAKIQAPTQLVLVSACLLGARVRYDGGHKLCGADVLQRWQHEARVVSFCPEVAAGFPTPRAPAEIADARGGEAVLAHRARVLEMGGRDVTEGFVAGAMAALQQVKRFGIRVTVLKEGSPSCGSAFTYDGSFAGGTTPLPGVTTALLRQHGIFVFSELELENADWQLRQLDATGAV
jgi:uncharacterized protein YbbK (DUF523 family)